jgi:hypothetical protein
MSSWCYMALMQKQDDRIKLELPEQLTRYYQKVRMGRGKGFA